MQTPKAIIRHSLWLELIDALKKKGAGRRETGAFLLASNGTTEIMNVGYYDDFDPHCFDTGIIVFDGNAFIPLWDYCRQTNTFVIADVHTHPDQWTGQSHADKTHPMISQLGHIALIVPRYAQKVTSLRGVGIYEYKGGYQWKTIKNKSNYFKIIK
ncbi:MAG: hypothetical protein P4L41_02895 [Flavipsychrobacter sp.]|nr:hypothetical protein [Flavipsychrobacter sp.]